MTEEYPAAPPPSSPGAPKTSKMSGTAHFERDLTPRELLAAEAADVLGDEPCASFGPADREEESMHLERADAARRAPLPHADVPCASCGVPREDHELGPIDGPAHGWVAPVSPEVRAQRALHAALEQERAYARDHIAGCSATLATYAAELRQERARAEAAEKRLAAWEPVVRAACLLEQGKAVSTGILWAAARALPPEARP